jgi:hypothetical protein
MAQNQINDSLFDELENFGKEQTPKQDTGGKANVGQVNNKAMDKLLKEASEYDKKSAKDMSHKSGDQSDFNEKMLDDKSKVMPSKPKVAEVKKEDMEPMGYIHNTHGKPQVVHDDPYLEPFMNDLYLRQNEYKK